MWDRPTFLDLPARAPRPRSRGVTHALDKGAGLHQVEGLLAAAADHLDVVKIGWGIAYVDAMVSDRIALYQSAGVLVCTGGTLLEVAVARGRLDGFRRFAEKLGFDAVEVSDGLTALAPGAKQELVAGLAGDFMVLAEVGAKDAAVPVTAAAWKSEMEADLAAGASWVVAEGRESGTVGLYEEDGAVRTDLVAVLAAGVPVDRIIFEAPRKAQQAWFIRRLGADVNLGNIGLEEVLALETLRLGLRADTAAMHLDGPGVAAAR